MHVRKETFRKNNYYIMLSKLLMIWTYDVRFYFSLSISKKNVKMIRSWTIRKVPS